MALITFEDLPSTNTPLNADNLNNNFEELNNNFNGTILYDNENGSTSTSISLEKPATGYSYLEITYGYTKASGIRFITKMQVGSVTNLMTTRDGYFNNSYYAKRISTKQIQLNSGKTILITNSGYTIDLDATSNIHFSDLIDEIYIYMVKGYK